MISRFQKLKDYRIFRDFTWSSDLHDFEDFNLIYGWNGTGKSSLTHVFRCLETAEDLNGEIDVIVDGVNISAANISSAVSLPKIKVFNKEFVQENVFTVDGQASSIYVIGSENVEKQKKLEELQKSQEEKRSNLAILEVTLANEKRAHTKHCQDKAKAIKEALRSPGQNPYNDFYKNNYAGSAMTVRSATEQGQAALLLGEETVKQKLSHVRSEVKEVVDTLPDHPTKMDDVIAVAKEICGAELVAASIEQLASDSVLSSWVKTGFELHKERHSDTCLFCENTFPDERMDRLSQHFNVAYQELMDRIDKGLEHIHGWVEQANALAMPPKSAFYQQFHNEWSALSSELDEFLSAYNEFLSQLKARLSAKKKNPFEKIIIDDLGEFDGTLVIKINALIQQSNNVTDEFEKSVTATREELEHHWVVESIREFNEGYEAVENLTNSIRSKNAEIGGLKSGIKSLEKDIRDNLRPAEELNADITAYLGRKEITFEVLDTGYEIRRGEVIADHLSEGERTAIAFLYFLKTLEDKDFNIQTGIVVIDDPISSLDSNSIYSAFSFLRERTKEAKQLFVLTHNFTFFRLVKNWFNAVQRQSRRVGKQAKFYMINCVYDGTKRASIIAPLDKLLREFEAEYHYLFWTVHETSQDQQANDLEAYYHLPNIARRLLEAFISFRYPKMSGDKIYKQLQNSEFDPVKKGKIERFLHTYSHNNHIDNPEHDHSILAETPAVLADLIEFMRHEDKVHVDQLEEIVRERHT